MYSSAMDTNAKKPMKYGGKQMKSIKYEFLFRHSSCVFNYLWTKMVGLCAVISKKVIGIVPDIKQPHNQHDLYIVPLFHI